MATIAESYRRSPKKIKTQILDEICQRTGLRDRKHVINRINRLESCQLLGKKPTRQRRRIYRREVLAIIEAVWATAGYPWSVRLKAILHLWLPAIRAHFSMTAETGAQLLRISPRTIDRALADRKHSLRKRQYGRTKPGTLLRRQIPIKCEHWDVTEPGHLEMDTISHCGGSGEGAYACSFNLTDIASTWVETRGLLRRGEETVIKAFSEMTEVLPFQVLDIDCDNGGEFINHNLYRYCDSRNYGFTRSRPYKKDDNAHIEQKNWTHVRKIIGWDRYETPEAVAILNDLYANELRLFMNLFQPSVKLIRTMRKGSRKTRQYDQPRTPLDRLAELPGADRAKIAELMSLRSRLDPFQLSATIQKKLERLWRHRASRSQARKTREYTPSEISRPLARALSHAQIQRES